MQVNSVSFKSEVLESKVPVLLDFGAAWCSPCRALNPILNELESESNGEYKVVKVDVDESQDIASEYGISSIPTLMLLEGGEVKRRKDGFSSKVDLLKFIKG
jgi:thioredoxin 1